MPSCALQLASEAKRMLMEITNYPEEILAVLLVRRRKQLRLIWAEWRMMRR